MDLFKIHNNTEILYGYHEASDIVMETLWLKILKNQKATPR